MTKIQLTLFSLLFSGCSLFVQLDSPNAKVTQKNKTSLEHQCFTQNKIQVISEHSDVNKTFKRYLESYPKHSFAQKVFHFLSIFSDARPDLNSPASNLTVLIKQGAEFNSYSSYSHQTELPYQSLQKSLIKSLNSKLKINHLLSSHKSIFSKPIKVEKTLHLFLNANRKEIVKDQTLSKLYMRGSEVLNIGEFLPKTDSTSLIKKAPFVELENLKLTAYNNDIKCNINMSKYQSSAFDSTKVIAQSSVFGFIIGDSSILAVSSGVPTIKSLGRTHFFQSTPSPQFLTPFCQMDPSTWTISSFGRDPGQHLYHLAQYGFSNAPFIKKVQIHDFSRYLFLNNPLRLLFEVDRSSKKQVENVLATGVPIYYEEKLGNIISLSKSSKGLTFIPDNRSKHFIECK